MKKNIEYASINSSLLGWLIDKLKGAPDDLQGAVVYRSILRSYKQVNVVH